MKTIQLRTEIPGPNSRALLARREAAIPRGPSNATPVFAARAEGAVIEDVDGDRYIDFAGGIGCLNAGHRSPRVVSALREQLEKHLHLCFAVTPYEGYVAVAEKLNALAPGNFAKKTILVNSGAEAIENSIKIARAYTKRPAVICFEDAFHGRTLLTLSLTSKTRPYKAGFQPFASDIYRIPYAYPYRHAAGTSAEDFAHHLEDAFKRSVAPESVAAVLAEPVLGEGGFVVPPPGYFKLLQKICREHGILFIADEVQSGFGRTGKWFASEHFGIEPDLIAMAKSLGGGVRGLGGMCAIELVRNAATREPADTETKQIARYCYEHGLITITAGTFNNVIRILVPLVVTDEQFDEGLDVIEAALAAVAEPKHAALSGPGADRWAGGRSGR